MPAALKVREQKTRDQGGAWMAGSVFNGPKPGKNPDSIGFGWLIRHMAADEAEQRRQTAIAWCGSALIWIVLAFTLYLIWMKTNP
ncbi:MAG: hypothetical protein WAM39_16775 [Bryobacteraceae bacterium]